LAPGITVAAHVILDDPMARLVTRPRRDGSTAFNPRGCRDQHHAGGRFASPEFSGVRTGRCRKADGLLMIQAALIPEQVADADAEVRRLLLAAVDEAELWAQRRSWPTRVPSFATWLFGPCERTERRSPPPTFPRKRQGRGDPHLMCTTFATMTS
jgi:hypothetical protein